MEKTNRSANTKWLWLRCEKISFLNLMSRLFSTFICIFKITRIKIYVFSSESNKVLKSSLSLSHNFIDLSGVVSESDSDFLFVLVLLFPQFFLLFDHFNCCILSMCAYNLSFSEVSVSDFSFFVHFLDKESLWRKKSNRMDFLECSLLTTSGNVEFDGATLIEII